MNHVIKILLLYLQQKNQNIKIDINDFGNQNLKKKETLKKHKHLSKLA